MVSSLLALGSTTVRSTFLLIFNEYMFGKYFISLYRDDWLFDEP
jgi:hypothetical protein